LSDLTLLTRLVHVKQNRPQTCGIGITHPPDGDFASDGNLSTYQNKLNDGASMVTVEDGDDDVEALVANNDA
jgi:hypothetical protein